MWHEKLVVSPVSRSWMIPGTLFRVQADGLLHILEERAVRARLLQGAGGMSAAARA
ncbi:hypothetical protein D9M69_500800 [compost metagenome]